MRSKTFRQLVGGSGSLRVDIGALGTLGFTVPGYNQAILGKEEAERLKEFLMQEESCDHTQNIGFPHTDMRGNHTGKAFCNNCHEWFQFTWKEKENENSNA
jgi:hypothetical protein